MKAMENRLMNDFKKLVANLKNEKDINQWLYSTGYNHGAGVLLELASDEDEKEFVIDRINSFSFDSSYGDFHVFESGMKQAIADWKKTLNI